MATQEPQSHRMRFTVPAADVSVVEWVNTQDNLSVSLRMLVREFIERHGMIDPTCIPVTQQPKRGRPTSSSRTQSRFDSVEDDERDEDYDTGADEDSSESESAEHVDEHDESIDNDEGESELEDAEQMTPDQIEALLRR